MANSNIPRVFTSDPVVTDSLQIGDQIIRNGSMRTYLGNAAWLLSESDVVLPGTNYCVNSVLGSDGNDGLSWAKPLATIAKAITLAIAGDRILIKGSFNESAVITAALVGVEIIGVGTGPNQAKWTSAADAYCLTLNAESCLVGNIKFSPPAYTAGVPAAIKLGNASYARILGNRFQGKTGSFVAIYSPVCNSDNVEISDNEFIYMNNVTTVSGKCILGIAAGGLTYSAGKIKRNDFNAPRIGIELAARVSLIEGNHFRVNGLLANNTLGAVSAKLINLSGDLTGCNHIHGNYLGGTYGTGMYTPATNDDWAGNYNIAGITAANPA